MDLITSRRRWISEVWSRSHASRPPDGVCDGVALRTQESGKRGQRGSTGTDSQIVGKPWVHGRKGKKWAETRCGRAKMMAKPRKWREKNAHPLAQYFCHSAGLLWCEIWVCALFCVQLEKLAESPLALPTSGFCDVVLFCTIEVGRKADRVLRVGVRVFGHGTIPVFCVGVGGRERHVGQGVSELIGHTQRESGCGGNTSEMLDTKQQIRW